MEALVSIVMPVYNPDELFLEQALRSIANQKYKFIELIISDDTETPSTNIKDLIVSFQTEIQLKYVKNERNRGIFSNLNNAINHSTGAFIQIFSQDDIMYDYFVQNQMAAFQIDSKIGMVFSAFEEIDDSGQMVISRTKKLFDPGKSITIHSGDMAEMFIHYGCFVGNISPVMIRKEVLSSTGYFNETLKFAADFEYWIRIGNVNDFYYCNSIGLAVRNHPERASLLLSNHQLMSDLKYIYIILLNGIPEDRKAKALSHIHSRVGASMVHHTVREIIKLNWPIAELKKRYHDLNEYPFNFLRSTCYYLFSIPGRIWSRLTI